MPARRLSLRFAFQKSLAVTDRSASVNEVTGGNGRRWRIELR